MMGNTLSRLLLQLIAPLFQLAGDRHDSAKLLDALCVNVRGVTGVALRFRQFKDGISGAVANAFTEHLQHLDGSA
jgi:hypothetical protein